MTGRGIDQILPHPCDPVLYEDRLKSALGYVALAERAHGPIGRPVRFEYIWGGALEALSRRAPDARIINLETAITEDGPPEPKGINYRMNPANVPVLTAAGIHCCVLANNHVMDWHPGRALPNSDAPGFIELLGGTPADFSARCFRHGMRRGKDHLVGQRAGDFGGRFLNL